MIYKCLKLPYPLSRYIDTIYYMALEGENYVRNIIPDGKTDIVFNLNSKKLGFEKDGKIIFSKDSVFQGLRKKNFIYHSNESADIIGVRLMPFGINSLFKIPLSEFSGEPIDLSLLLGKDVKLLEEKMSFKKEVNGKIKIVYDWLYKLFIKRDERHGLLIDTVYRIYSTQGKSSINLACKDNYNYYKKVQRSFRQSIGVSPKFYARMVRFESIHNTLLTSIHQHKKEIDWLGMVTKFDFFDQSHLSKEFQFFTNYSPQEFVNKIEGFV